MRTPAEMPRGEIGMSTISMFINECMFYHVYSLHLSMVPHSHYFGDTMVVTWEWDGEYL